MFTGTWTVLVTPFKEGGRKIDFECVARLVAMQVEAEVDGLVVAGTTGESPTLDEHELLELVSFVIKEAGGMVPVLVGTGTNSTRKTIEMTKRAKDLGGNGAFVIVPYYNKPTDRGVIEHFRELDKLHFPLVLYHHPGRTSVRLKIESIIEIAELNHVVAIKECSGDLSLVTEILRRRPDTVIFSGDDDLTLKILEAGGKGAFSVISNLIPKLYKEMVEAGSREIYLQIEPLVRAIQREVNPQGIKCAMALAGHCEGALRLPLVSVTAETRDIIKTELEKLLLCSNSL